MKNFERTLLRKFFSSKWIEQLKILFKDYRAHYSDIETLRGGVAVENWHSSKRTRSSGGAILWIRIKYWWPAWYRLMRIHRIPFPSLPQRFVSRLSLEEDSSSLLLPLLLSYIIVALSLYLQISAPPSFSFRRVLRWTFSCPFRSSRYAMPPRGIY